MKRIGFDATSITKDHDGGKNQVALNLLRGFEKNGVAGRFVVFCNPGMDGDILELIPGATVIPVESGTVWKKAITEIWTRTFVLPTYIKRYRIGVLLFPARNTGMRRLRIPTVVIPHDIQPKTHRERFSVKTRIFHSIIYHFDFKLRDRIIAISDFDRQEIAMMYPSCEHKIIRIFNPIFTDHFVSPDSHRAARPYITAVNIQHPHKNTITLIKAFHEIKDDIPHDLCLVGKINGQMEFLVSYVNKHRLNDRVIFKGFIDDEHLAGIVKNSALFVNSSLYEGFGMTCVEAMLAGVPTLASKVAATPEVTMGLCDYYAPPDDAGALAESMKRILLQNKETTGYRKMISGMIYNEYNYFKISREYFDLLTSLMQEGAGNEDRR